MPSSAGLDIYLNHVVGDQNPNQQVNQSDAYSPSQPRPPQTPTRSNSIENSNEKLQCPQDKKKKVADSLTSLHFLTFLHEML